MTVYGYARVSTTKQDYYGGSLQGQVERLEEHGAQVVYHETYSAANRNRPKLEALLDMVQEGDTFMCTSLDRIARTTIDGIEIVSQLRDRGVRIHILNLGVIDDNPMGKFTMTILFAIAEFERNMIMERTQEGIERAKQKPDYNPGRPAFEVDEAFRAMQAKVQKNELSVAKACEKLGISRSTWYKYRQAA